jgi:hypothetical protein
VFHVIIKRGVTELRKVKILKGQEKKQVESKRKVLLEFGTA